MATATTVRVRDGKRVVTDGPFAETREQLGGFYWIEAKDLDEALAIAERMPVGALWIHRSEADGGRVASGRPDIKYS